MAVWWFEPNLRSAPPQPEIPASIETEICSKSGAFFVCGGGQPSVDDIGAQRFVMDGVGGGTYRLTIHGVNIPTSSNAAYITGQKRKIHWAYYYEDRLRDDADGPDCCDEIDLDYATCCAQVGSSCPAVCP